MEIKNIKDIARLAGASVGSTSMVLNGKWHKKVRTDLAEKILKTAEKYNYKLNPLGRSLQLRQYLRIAILMEGSFMEHSPIGALSFYDFIRIIADKLNKNGYALDIIQLDNEKIKQILNNGSFPKHNDAFIFLEWHPDKLRKLLTEVYPEQPYIIIGNNYNNPDWSYAYRATEEMSRQAVDHFIKNGHRKIVISRVAGSHERFQQKVAGYKKALKEAGIAIDRNLIVDLKYKTHSLGSGAQILEKLKGYAEPPTAFFCDDNIDALSILIELQRVGIDVPGQVEIIGYGDTAVADMSSIPLSYLRIPNVKIAEFAIDYILKILSNCNKNVPVQKQIEEDLILQKTTR